jgi:gas vesicle protein
MFNSTQTPDTKIAVLEERLSSFEIVMKRIDEAIQLLGQTNQNISKMLAVHEEKIENCNKSDDTIVKMIDEMKDENKEQHSNVTERIKSLEKKVEELVKFRWIIAGAAIILSFAFSQSSVIIDVLTPEPTPVILDQHKK